MPSDLYSCVAETNKRKERHILTFITEKLKCCSQHCRWPPNLKMKAAEPTHNMLVQIEVIFVKL